MMKRGTGLLALIVLLAFALVPVALAGPPLEMEKFEESDGPFLDPFLTEVCEFDVFVEFDVKGKFMLFDDFSSKEHVNVHVVFSNPANGAMLVERDAFNVFSEPVIEIVEDTTLTLMFSDTFKGLPLRLMQPGEGMLIRDAGKVTFDVTLVIDLGTGEVIFFDEEINMKGPHPFLDLSQEEAVGIICEALDNG